MMASALRRHSRVHGSMSLLTSLRREIQVEPTCRSAGIESRKHGYGDLRASILVSRLSGDAYMVRSPPEGARNPGGGRPTRRLPYPLRELASAAGQASPYSCRTTARGRGRRRQIAAGGGADRRSATIAAAPINQSREAQHSARPRTPLLREASRPRFVRPTGPREVLTSDDPPSSR
jgi:hypothetical protein